MSALKAAINRNDLKAVQDYIESDPELLHYRVGNYCPQHIACQNGNYEIIEYLYKCDPKLFNIIDTKQDSKKIPLYYLITLSHFETLNKLAKNYPGLIIDSKDEEECSVLFELIRTRCHTQIYDLIRALSKSKTSKFAEFLNSPDIFGMAPLFYAILERQYYVVYTLIDNGADAKYISDKSIIVQTEKYKFPIGCTPLHLACYMTNLDMVKAIRKCGAKDEFTPNSHGLKKPSNYLSQDPKDSVKVQRIMEILRMNPKKVKPRKCSSTSKRPDIRVVPDAPAKHFKSPLEKKPKKQTILKAIKMDLTSDSDTGDSFTPIYNKRSVPESFSEWYPKKKAIRSKTLPLQEVALPTYLELDEVEMDPAITNDLFIQMQTFYNVFGKLTISHDELLYSMRSIIHSLLKDSKRTVVSEIVLKYNEEVISPFRNGKKMVIVTNRRFSYSNAALLNGSDVEIKIRCPLFTLFIISSMLREEPDVLKFYIILKQYFGDYRALIKVYPLITYLSTH